MRTTLRPKVDAGVFQPHARGSREYVAVERGALLLTIDGEEHLLRAGDPDDRADAGDHHPQREHDCPVEGTAPAKAAAAPAPAFIRRALVALTLRFGSAAPGGGLGVCVALVARLRRRRARSAILGGIDADGRRDVDVKLRLVAR